VFFALQSFLEKYKKQLVISGGIGVALLFYLIFIQQPSGTPSIETIDPIATLASPNGMENAEQSLPVTSSPSPPPIMVDVKGAIKYPGVYTLEEGQRIVEAIEMAGGYTENANATLINHAQKLQDEMVIYIPKIGEELTGTMGELIQYAENSGSSGNVNNSGKINLNKASESELTQLPGIGPSKASAIIKHRTEQGQFHSIEELKNVTGIGDKTFEQLKDLIDTK
jgi:competence protein ComEA